MMEFADGLHEKRKARSTKIIDLLTDAGMPIIDVKLSMIQIYQLVLINLKNE